ncbi:MAG: hypothetical protein ABSF55_02040 [Candidatus Staskawiczbacteria bacterium]
MKLKYATKKIDDAKKQCGICAAGFEIWLNNSRFSEERREKVSQHLLKYCPVCVRVGEK